MANIDSVASARKRVGAELTALLKDLSDRQISQAGSKKTRDQLPPISSETGLWRDAGTYSKPLAWLVHFTYDSGAGLWRAQLPNTPHAGRLYGGFNTKSPLQGVLCRVLPVARIDTLESGQSAFAAHPYWEWAIAFVFPGLAVFTEGGSSGATIDFDPVSGRLDSTIEGQAVEQPYVSTGLFALAPPDDVWHIGNLAMTYAEATDALSAMINVEPITPSSAEAPEEEA